jgi:hypothetical protein
MPAQYNGRVTMLNPGDLEELERAALGILGAGLAPSSVAGDPSFRLDVLIATSFALVQGLAPGSYLEPSGGATAAFQRRLTDAFHVLEDKKILGMGGPPPEVRISPGTGAFRAPGQDPIANFDQHPTVFDRHLAGRCLDEILRNGDVYRYVMGKYAESSEIWQRVYRQYM